MERCQETSHAPPMEAEVTAATPNQMYQGTEAVRGVEMAFGDAAAAYPDGWMEPTEVDMLGASLGVEFRGPRWPLSYTGPPAWEWTVTGIAGL